MPAKSLHFTHGRKLDIQKPQGHNRCLRCMNGKPRTRGLLRETLKNTKPPDPASSTPSGLYRFCTVTRHLSLMIAISNLFGLSQSLCNCFHTHTSDFFSNQKSSRSGTSISSWPERHARHVEMLQNPSLTDQPVFLESNAPRSQSRFHQTTETMRLGSTS